MAKKKAEEKKQREFRYGLFKRKRIYLADDELLMQHLDRFERVWFTKRKFKL